MAKKRDRDKPEKKKHKRKHPDKTKTVGAKPATPGGTTEKLKEKSTQSGQDALDAAPGSMAEAQAAQTEAAVYSTGPGAVVAYNYQREGTYAEDYAQQQQVQPVQVVGATPSAAALGT